MNVAEPAHPLRPSLRKWAKPLASKPVKMPLLVSVPMGVDVVKGLRVMIFSKAYCLAACDTIGSRSFSGGLLCDDGINFGLHTFISNNAKREGFRAEGEGQSGDHGGWKWATGKE